MIFISYSRRDADYALHVAQLLRASGHDVFIDTHSLRYGKDWKQQISDSIAQSERLFLFWSKSAAASPHVAAEWKTALAVPTCMLVPVILDRTPLPSELGHYHGVGDFDRLIVLRLKAFVSRWLFRIGAATAGALVVSGTAWLAVSSIKAWSPAAHFLARDVGNVAQSLWRTNLPAAGLTAVSLMWCLNVYLGWRLRRINAAQATAAASKKPSDHQSGKAQAVVSPSRPEKPRPRYSREKPFMMPLGYIRSYQDFGLQFRGLVEERNREGRAFGFLFDDRHLTVERSRLAQDMRTIRALNDELGEDITVLYLHDSAVRLNSSDARRQYRERMDEFNRTLISTLGVPKGTICLPCLTLFRVHGEACSHVRQVPLEPRSTLFLVANLIEGIRSYRELIASDRGVTQRVANGFWPAIRGPLTVVDLVNTVSDFADRASQVVQSFLF